MDYENYQSFFDLNFGAKKNMFLEVNELDKFYKKLKQDHLNSGTILIFVSPNVDALCSCKILTVCVFI